MTDSIKKLDIMRTMYKAKNDRLYTSAEEDLKEIKVELQVANAVKAAEVEEAKGLNAIHSPYLADQPYYNKEVLYNSPKETDWKDVRTEEQNRRAAYNFQNLKKLNIV